MDFSYSYTPEAWPALIAFAVVTYLGRYSWRRRSMPGATPFAVACLMSTLWTLGVILELSAAEIRTRVFWFQFQSLWQLPVATSVACFVLHYAGLGRWLNRRTYVLLFLVPVLAMLAMATNDAHHLVWAGFRMNRYVIAEHGRLYWLFNSYIYLLAIVNFAVLVHLALRSPRHRWPVAIIISAQVLARVAYTLDMVNQDLLAPGESVLIVLGLVAAAYAVAFFRFHAIEPVAASRKAVLEQMREAMFVLDLHGRILDVNETAASILGSSAAQLRQKLARDVLPVDAGFLEEADSPGIDNIHVTLGEGNCARHYDMNLTPLREPGGGRIGQLLLLHDVTEQKRAQTRILEQQTVVSTLQERERLARELHDGIGQVLGYVGVQTQAAVKWLQDGRKDKAESILRRLVEVAQDAHADVRESIVGLRTGPAEQWAFIPRLKDHMDRFQANYGIRAELVLADRAGDHALDSAAGVQVLRVIQEALTNSRKHGLARTVRLRVETGQDLVRITIADDGSGFDADRLERGGGHFGLDFMRERMKQVGGSLTIDSVPGSGTTLRLDAPVRRHTEESP
jgi:PAS domain S-box-containing protein